MGNACHIMITVLCMFMVLCLLICCLNNFKFSYACLCLALLPPIPHTLLAHFWCTSSPLFRTLITAGWSMDHAVLHTTDCTHIDSCDTIKPFTPSHLIMGPYVPTPLSLPTRGLEPQLTLQCSLQRCYMLIICILLSQSHSIYNHNYSC